MSHENPVFGAITTAPELQTPQPAHLGRSEISVVDSSTKSVRKATRKIESLVDHNILHPEVHTTEQALRHEKDGAVYVGVSLNGDTPQFIRPQLERKGIPDENQCFITGSCLFGELNAQAITDAGTELSVVNQSHVQNLGDETITQVQTVQGLHPYEIDTILRLSETFRLLQTDNREAYLHIPEVEYWMYICDAFNNGNATQKALLEWCSGVTAHADNVSNVFAKRVQKSADVRVNPYNPFEQVYEQLQQGIVNGELPPVADVTQQLYDTSLAWQQVLESEHPQTFGELAMMANVVPYIHAACQHGGLTAIENPEEQKILSSANHVIPEETEYLSGLYVHPRILITDPHSITGDIHDLYYVNGGNNGLQAARQILQINRTP